MSGPLTPRVGETFGAYTIEALLGRGGMATVYLATHDRLARRVAVKVIAPDLADDDVFRERFLRESRLAASLDHPNVIPVYDADEIDGVLFIAMRYVAGPSLRELIRERGALPLDETLRLADQLAGALDAAHAAGLVHRDVKPANVLLTETREHAYLCDFGLAKRTGADGVTRTGSFLGTADYCAPEQISGRAVDGRADVYSLACVLFQCLTGVPPYRRDGELEVLYAHLHDDVPSASAVAELPPFVDSALRRGMAKDPAERYATAGALAAALAGRSAGHVDDETTRAAQIPVPSAARGPRAHRALRSRLWAVAAVALAGVAAATVALATHRSSGSTNDAGLRTFVQRIENVLSQSAAGRGEIRSALVGGVSCAIPPRDAALRIASVADNRQSILGQLGALEPPTQQADDVVTFLQESLEQSVEADRHYRDAFLVAGRKRRCPLPPNRDFALAAEANTRATAAKRRFVSAFDPLARRFNRRTWTAADF